MREARAGNFRATQYDMIWDLHRTLQVADNVNMSQVLETVLKFTSFLERLQVSIIQSTRIRHTFKNNFIAWIFWVCDADLVEILWRQIQL